jgi:membrane-bound lytic murein transglycosylase A
MQIEDSHRTATPCVTKVMRDPRARMTKVSWTRRTISVGSTRSAALLLWIWMSPATRVAAVIAFLLPTACASSPADVPTPVAAGAGSVSDIRTRHALFRPATFDELPGWTNDDLQAAWDAFGHSCAVLQRREGWREICAARPAQAQPTHAMRVFFESRFALLRILNTDASREGEVTGYFEPLLAGRRQRSAEFNLPVLGVPRDLYTIDWTKVPATQRRGVVHVKPLDGNTLVVTAPDDGAAHALDMSRFELDTRDRRLRLRLTRAGGSARALPYHSRAELDALALPHGIDVPVIAWVNDPLALYAMQVQGSGRIRMPDGAVLRVHYGEQNGHAFRPLRVVAKADNRVVTRGIGAAQETTSEFMLEADAAGDAAAAGESVRSRGLTRPAGKAAGRDEETDALVEELLRQARRSPAATGRPQPLPSAETAAGTTLPATARPTGTGSAAAALLGDPSYVFFKLASDQSPGAGPLGALGVPLTAGRSVAVDPRVTPLGYPVFLSARVPGASSEIHQLMFAQDTGGAIRGALRADYFWGFGATAGQMARSTRHRSQLWVLLPKAEADSLVRGSVSTRGLPGRTRAAGECLVADDEFCAETD